jgi:hypothetical protein
MLLGYGATLPSPSGSDQIVIGAAGNTTYIAGALSLNGALNLSGGTGTSGQYLRSTGTGVTWGDGAPGTLSGYTSNFTALGVQTPGVSVSGVAIGNGALAALTTGTGNVAVGTGAGASVTAGTNNVIIGDGAGAWVGSNCTVLGAGATASQARGDHQIVLGTASDALYIQGGLNLRWGGTITVSRELQHPLAQFYLVTDAAGGSGAITITLPPVSQQYTGATVILRRASSNFHAITVTSVSGQLVSDSDVNPSGNVTILANKYQSMFICNNTNWYQMFTS